MSNAVPKDLKNLDTNSDPRSEVTCEGTPCLEKTWLTNNFASSGAVIVLYVGMNIACFDKRSTMTKISEKPLETGSCSMKSILMEFQGFSGMGSCFKKP